MPTGITAPATGPTRYAYHDVQSTLEQTVRARHEADHSHRALARELSVDRLALSTHRRAILGRATARRRVPT